MKNNKKITIFSTFAIDKLIDKNRRIIREQKGGPAFYIASALKRENINFNLIKASLVRVEILIKDGEEFGRIRQKNKPKKINFSAINTPLILISTILNDFDLKGASTFKGNIFLDVQGYVRNGIEFGKKKQWKPSKEIASSIFCLKGTEEELSFIPFSLWKEQKQKILLITKGKLGCEIWNKGKKETIKPKKIIKNIENVIGAGDSFFAYFISKFLRTENPFLSAKCAADKTSEFLAFNRHSLKDQYVKS
jgi:hypothetical protein